MQKWGIAKIKPPHFHANSLMHCLSPTKALSSLRWSPIECCFTAQHANSKLSANSSSFAASINKSRKKRTMRRRNNKNKHMQEGEEKTRSFAWQGAYVIWERKEQGAPPWFWAFSTQAGNLAWTEFTLSGVERGFWVWWPVGSACFSLHSGISITSCELGEHVLVTPCLLDFTDNQVICSPNYHPLSATSASVLCIHSFFLEHYMPESRHFQILHQFHQLFISYHV